jgi:APA family basic amino acid/polyamine antiporter
VTDFAMFGAVVFETMTVASIFVFRWTRPDAERPYRAFGYPVIPALYIVVASAIAIVLLIYKPATSLPGLGIVLTGIPVYFAWRHKSS